MKILHFLLVPSDERFTVLSDAIAACSDDQLGIAAIYSNGLQVLLPRETASVGEFGSGSV